MSDISTEESVAPEARADLIAQLTRLAADPANRIYAVIDGSVVPFIFRKLTEAGIAHRSLYREAEPGLRAGGPWLADLHHQPLTDEDLYEPSEVPGTVRLKAEVKKRPADPARQLLALMEKLDDSRGAVFWVGGPELTEEALYRHLRGLNRVSVATEPGSLFRMETVTFRHADANVMAQVLPALSPPRFARIIGPAQAVIFTPYAEWEGAQCCRALRPAQLPPAPKGMLDWDAATMAAISERRQAKFRREIADYLREVAPARTRGMDPAELDRLVKASMRDGLALGVRSVAAHCRWAYLALVTNGELAKAPEIREFMTVDDPDHSPDQRVGLLMRETLSSLQTMEAR